MEVSMRDSQSVLEGRRAILAACLVAASLALAVLAVWLLHDETPQDRSVASANRSGPEDVQDQQRDSGAFEPTRIREPDGDSHAKSPVDGSAEKTSRELKNRDQARLRRFSRPLPPAAKLLDDETLNPMHWSLSASDAEDLDSLISSLNTRRQDLQEDYSALADELALARIQAGEGDVLPNGVQIPITLEQEQKNARVMIMAQENQPTKQVVVTSADSPQLSDASSKLDDFARGARDKVDEFLRTRGNR
jgi:hypothetical protein